MKSRIQVLDGLRGIAIVGVVWHHLFEAYTRPGFVALGPRTHPFLPLNFLSNGWLGVNLFFVLSGFVLFYPYVKGSRKLATGGDWLAYYRNRAFRLLPLYYVSVLYGFLVIAPPKSSEQWLRDLPFMLTATFGFTKRLWFPQYNWVLWSLGIEIWFSILFPVLAVLALRFSAARLLVGAAALALVVRFIGLQEAFQIRGSIYLGPLRDSVLGRLDDFALGMFMAWLWSRSARGKSAAWASAWVPLAGLVLVFAASHLWDYAALGILPLRAVPLINPILLTGIFLFLMHLLNADNALTKVLSWKVFTVPGLMCYSIYIWHGVLRLQLLGPSRAPEKLAVYLAVLAIVSYLSFRFIEMNKAFRPKK